MNTQGSALTKRISITCASLFLATTALTAPAAQADPLALVIGNSIYQHAPDAEDARRDARHVADAFRDAGYEVFEGYDLGAAAMQDLLVRFERAARETEEDDGLAIFVSGQAVRADGRGYFAPSDLDPSTLSELRLKAAPVDLFLDLASLAPGRSEVILDLSRPEGFAPTEIIEPGFVDLNDPEGVLVVSSAEPGETSPPRGGGVSPFAELAADEILKPGALANAAALTLAARMRSEHADWPQVWVTGDADEDFALVAAPEGASAELRAQMELEAWRAAEVSGRRSDYERYLDFFPDGSFVDIAQDRISAIDAAEAEDAAARRAEAALRLDAQERARVQANLNALGYNTGGIDGVFGPASRRSIGAWQRKRGEEATGYLTETQYLALRDQARELTRASRSERNAWDDAERLNTIDAYQAYLDDYPDGRRADDARSRIAEIRASQAAEARSPQRDEAALALSRRDRVAVQRTLTALGFDTRGIDGALGPDSRRAIAAWQRDRGDRATGYLTAPQVADLRDAAETLREAAARDERDWRDAQEANTIEAFEAYLTSHPQGEHVAEARNSITELHGEAAAQSAARKAEADLDMGRRQRRMVQSTLTQLGFDAGAADGEFGPGTRRAIALWQRDRGDRPTSYLTKEQFEELQDRAREFRRAARDESEAWTAATNANTIESYQEYLDDHPDGDRAAEARDRIAALRRDDPTAQTPDALEASLNLSRADRIAVQRALTARGYDTRGVDGAFGPGTRRAISLWQRDLGDIATGYLTQPQFDALTQTASAPTSTPSAEEDEWSRATERDTADAYGEYLRRYPNGRYAAEAERRIADLRDRSEDVAIARDEERRQNFTDGQRRSIEGRLATLGYDPGSQDGRFTERTRDAIAGFQRAQGILDSGYADQATVRRLVELTPQVTQQEMIGSAIEGIFRQLDK